ncbi:ubiquitin carboxyl-terminal hydrolase 20-like [Glycine soja]|uniref:Ubiquitin carboxyl-terminal hydrolase n=2 Tax=Glycine soja TaxID=3848 RepID=A0A445LXP5_GLYSO|nr:ubiquitin carboxyl-terminal hydrolase 20-like [Glycine soja]RZC28033.1 Ubiquitin carboxyl-terminal hydrolase 20 isoform A [Glycine soja]
MCLSLSSPAMASEEPMDAPPAPNLLSETLSAAELVADLGGDYALFPPGGGSTEFRQLDDDVSSSLWSSALVSNSRVSAVAPESWIAPQGNWLLPENEGSDNAESASEVVPSKMGAGLVNLGNTCFLNAILQCFTHTVPLVQGLRSSTHPIPCSGHKDGFCVICALRIHVERSLAASGGTFSPLEFVNNLKYFSSDFRRYQQEDAHEFMQCTLDKLERCFLGLKKSNLNFEDVNLVEKVFGGRLISKLQCSTCDHTSNTFEPLIDMSLEIDNVDSLPSALESFTKVENIDDNLQCDNCKEEVSMEKQLMLDQTPSVAAFHLKRFKTDGILVEKIDKHIDFPLELDLQPYTIKVMEDPGAENDVPLKYDLYAIVVHTGLSSTSGHYFCFVRSAPDTWHKLDDSMVTEVSVETVLSQEAYILFYARQGTPWFLSIMEEKTQCLNPNIMSTSPKSVLDVGDNMCKSNPILLPNIERSVAEESKEYSEPQFDYYCQEDHGFLEINDTEDVTHGSGQLLSGSNQEIFYSNTSKDVDAQKLFSSRGGHKVATHGCGQLLSGLNQESVGLNSSKNVDAQQLFRNWTTLDDSAMFDIGNSYIENGSLDNDNTFQEAVDFLEKAGFHSLTLPSLPPDDAPDKFHISCDNLKRQNHRSCKRSSNKLTGDSEERREAVKYLCKNRSRRGALLKFVTPNKVLDKKRKNMDSLQCKKSTKKPSHTSVTPPVAAGSSR